MYTYTICYVVDTFGGEIPQEKGIKKPQTKKEIIENELKLLEWHKMANEAALKSALLQVDINLTLIHTYMYTYIRAYILVNSSSMSTHMLTHIYARIRTDQVNERRG